MTDRYWICVYSDPTEGIRGVAGAGSGEATNDLPLLIAEEDLFCEVFNPELEPGLWILAGSVGVRHRHKEEPDLDYREDESSPAPTWRRLTGPELDVISKGEAPPEMTKWLAGEAWAETAGTSIADEMRRVAERLQTAEFYDDMPISEAADLLRGGGGEAGGMTTQPIARLDRTQPPPGYTLTPSCGVWVADKRGDLIREADSFDDEANAIAAAWDHFEALYQPLGESDEPSDAEFADEDEGPWWRISLMGHRTVVSRIESATLHGLPMWRLRDEGGELLNPATAVFSAEPWDDVRPLKGLPEGVRAHRSPHTRGEWFVAGFGRSWHVRIGEAELRDRLAALPALVARWNRLPRSIRFRLYQAVDAVPELDTIRQLVELGEREEVNESLARGDSLLAQVADHGPGDTHGASLETELGLPDADERELADHDAQDPGDDKIPF